MMKHTDFSRHERDFYVGYLVGWRAWLLPTTLDGSFNGDLTVKSTFRNVDWVPDVDMVAECMTGTKGGRKLVCGLPASSDHTHADGCYELLPLLDVDCSCGFYGYVKSTRTGIPDWNAYTGPGNRVVVKGLVAGFGRTVIGDFGFRAEKARVLAFYGLPTRKGPATVRMREPSVPDGVAVMRGLEATYRAPWFNEFGDAVSVIPVSDVEQFRKREDVA